MSTRRDIEVAEEFAAALAERLGANLERVSLFGSRARGDHKPFSDFDLMVVVRRADRDARSAVHGTAVRFELDRLIDLSTKIVDVDRFESLRRSVMPFWKRFNHDEVCLWPTPNSPSA